MRRRRAGRSERDGREHAREPQVPAGVRQSCCHRLHSHAGARPGHARIARMTLGASSLRARRRSPQFRINCPKPRRRAPARSRFEPLIASPAACAHYIATTGFRSVGSCKRLRARAMHGRVEPPDVRSGLQAVAPGGADGAWKVPYARSSPGTPQRPERAASPCPIEELVRSPQLDTGLIQVAAAECPPSNIGHVMRRRRRKSREG
jgi:hypothetical protein